MGISIKTDYSLTIYVICKKIHVGTDIVTGRLNLLEKLLEINWFAENKEIMDLSKLLRKTKDIITSNALLFGTVTGVIVGLIIGLLLKPFQSSEVLQSLVSYPGELYMRALTLLIIPVIISSLISGAASMNIKTNGKLALRTFSYFLVTSLCNAAFGIILAVAIQPGDSFIKTELQDNAVVSSNIASRQNTLLDNFLDLGRNIVPNNVFTSFFEMATTVYAKKTDADGEEYFVKSLEARRGVNAIGVIFYSLLFGSALSLLEQRAKPLLDVIKTIDDVNIKTITGLLWLTPFGVASLICGKVLEVDDVGKIFGSVIAFIFTVCVGILIYQLIVLQLLYFIFVRKNPFPFYTRMLPAALTGFAVDSSTAAMPVTLKCLDEFGIDTRISRFVVPIGVTCNMDGTALFHGISSVFIAQMNNIPLDFGDYLTICVTATAVSIAAVGTPSASLTLMPIILNAIGAPIQDIGLLFAIDWLCDRIRTTNNVLADAYTSAIVEKWSQKELKENDENEAKPANFTNENVDPMEMINIASTT